MSQRVAIIRDNRIINIILVDEESDIVYHEDFDEYIIDSENVLMVNSVRENGVWLSPEPMTVELPVNEQLIQMQDTAVEISKIILFEENMTSEKEEELFGLIVSVNRPWVSNQFYSSDTNDIVIYEDLLYRCVQSHVSQVDWFPTAVPALWTRYDPPGTIPEWRQPTGAHDAYPYGAIVTHNGKTWVSLYDANVWEPGVFGWNIVT